jgi:hypothetical protein
MVAHRCDGPLAATPTAARPTISELADSPALAELRRAENAMETIAYLLPALGCAGMMAGMMWMMRDRGSADSTAPDERQREIAQLRSEIASLDAPEAGDEREPRRA